VQSQQPNLAECFNFWGLLPTVVVPGMGISGALGDLQRSDPRTLVSRSNRKCFICPAQSSLRSPDLTYIQQIAESKVVIKLTALVE